jgi:acetyl-CoA C-acetyltransferase
MLFECFLQLRQEATPERQIASIVDGRRKLGLTHNLGGEPGALVSFVGIVGTEPNA